MTRIGYRNLGVVVTALSGLACVIVGRAAAASDGGLEKFTTEAVVLKSASQTATFDADNGKIVISTGQGDRSKKRAEVAFESVKHFQRYKTVHNDTTGRHGIAVCSESGEAEFNVLADDKGVFEFQPGKTGKLDIHGLRFRYAMVPALIGTDFVYNSKTDYGKDLLHIPAINMLLGLIEGEDCMAVCVWPTGKQSAALKLDKAGEPKLFDGLTFDTAGQSFYFSCQEKPDIWHAEPLNRKYLEKDTVIAWKRPFEAKWIGRFFITSDEYDWPFYFVSKPSKIWGRYIRGWYKYPVRFDDDRTVIHFEKQFQPKGELLIYCLEPHPTNPDATILTPAEVMSRALGKAEADKILDPEGTVEQTLLDHRLAVCAMTNTMQKWFDEGKEAEHRDQIVRWCDDTSAFIRMIRRRDQAFAEFASDLKILLADTTKEHPELAKSCDELQGTLAVIDRYGKELPTTELETVRQWTDDMKKAALEGPGESKRTFAKLGGQCRSVAGTQDDLARDLSIQVIRLTEQAARLGTQSSEHAKLAEEIIVKSRQLLRKPTWWEPTRRFEPKSDPGNVF